MNLFPPLEPHKISNIIKQWIKVNPETPTGIRFEQDIEHQKALIKDKLYKV